MSDLADPRLILILFCAQVLFWGTLGMGGCFAYKKLIADPQHREQQKSQHVQIRYLYPRDTRETHEIIPENIYFGSTPSHPEPQWLLRAIDTNKGIRTFAMKNIKEWVPVPKSVETDAP